MESFYGGRPGSSFVIVKTFPNEESMKAAFALGPNYTDVYFDEYVMIESPTISDTHGKVYRRGYDYTNTTTRGAEYIGKITGPVGPMSKIELTDFSDIEAYETEYPNNVISVEQPATSILELNPNDEEDKIIWKYYYLQNQDGTYTIKLGVKVPAPEFDLNIELTEPDSEVTIEKSHKYNEEDEIEHPFYTKWTVSLPKAIKGDSIDAVTVINTNDMENYDIANPNEIDVPSNGKLILLYHVIAYDKDGNVNQAKSYWYYAGDFNPISGVDISDAGYLKFWLQGAQHQDEYAISSSHPIIPQITDISFNEEDGTITFEWKKYENDPNPATTKSLELPYDLIANTIVQNSHFKTLIEKVLNEMNIIKLPLELGDQYSETIISDGIFSIQTSAPYYWSFSGIFTPERTYPDAVWGSNKILKTKVLHQTNENLIKQVKFSNEGLKTQTLLQIREALINTDNSTASTNSAKIEQIKNFLIEKIKFYLRGNGTIKWEVNGTGIAGTSQNSQDFITMLQNLSSTSVIYTTNVETHLNLSLMNFAQESDEQ